MTKEQRLKIAAMLIAGILTLFVAFWVSYTVQQKRDNFTVQYTEKLTNLVDSFYGQYNSGTYGFIYDYMTDSIFHSKITKEQFEGFMAALKADTGKVELNVLVGYEWKRGRIGRFCEMRYTVQREKVQTIEGFTIRKENGLWLIVDYEVNI